MENNGFMRCLSGFVNYLIVKKKRLISSHRESEPLLSLSDTEHGWAHGSNTVFSVIHGSTGTIIELQSCLGTTKTRL